MYAYSYKQSYIFITDYNNNYNIINHFVMTYKVNSSLWCFITVRERIAINEWPAITKY